MRSPCMCADGRGSRRARLARGAWAFVAFGLLAHGALAADAVSGADARAQAILIHSHNDYERPRPLFDALDHRAGSVEADVHLIEGRLLVAHDLEDVRPERTLELLYLDPLRERIRRQGGSVYPNDRTPLILLVDVKSEAAATYAVLAGILERYADILTVFHNGQTLPGAVTVIVSVNRDRGALERAARRLAAMDGRSSDLGGGASAELIPLVSDNWARFFAWRGDGPMPDGDKERLRALAGQAKREGRLLRFWNASDRVEVWRELRAAGVHVIGTDDPAALRRFLDEG